MLRIINGQQRSGKSFYCVKYLVNVLVKTERPICTNLPLVVDEISKLVSRRKGCELEAVASRLTVLDHDQVKEFWRHSKPNSVILLDELYEVFSARDWKSASDELLSYTRQHGHYQDDLFLISHDLADLNATIRRGANEIIMIRNTRHMNFFGDSKMAKYLFSGLKYPYTRFKAYHYEKDQFRLINNIDSAVYVESLVPEQCYFDCYDSFSHAQGVAGKALAEGETESDNIENRPYVKQIYDSVIASWFAWVLLLSISFSAYYGYSTFMNYLRSDFLSSKPSESKPVEHPKQSKTEGLKRVDSMGQVSAVNKSEPVPPVVGSPRIMNARVVELVDGTQFVRGLKYGQFELYRIEKNGVLIWLLEDKLYYSSVQF